MKQCLITICAIWTTSVLTAQTQFHRTYSTSGDNHIVLDAVGSDGGNTYAVAGLQIDASGDQYDALLVTSFNSKGNVNYSNVIYSEDSTDFVGGAAIARGFNGMVYIAGTVDRDSDNVLLYAMEDRNLGFDQVIPTYAIESSDTKPTVNRLVVAPDSTLILATQRNDVDGAALLKITFDGELLWSRSMSSARMFDQVSALSIRPDSTASLSGSAGPDAWQLRVDSTGAIVFGRLLSLLDGNDLSIYGEYEVNDSVSCIVGAVTNSVLYSGFMALVDQADSVLWARQTDFGDPMIASVLYHVDLNLSEDLLRVFGEVEGPDNTVFVLDVDITSGQQLMHYVIDSSAVLARNRPSSGLVVRDGGYTYLGMTARDGGLQHNHIRLDEDISTGCSGTSMQEVLAPLVLSVDTLVGLSQEEGRIDSVVARGVFYQGYTHPVLSLLDTLVCGNLPFTKLYDASFLDDATAFMWTLPDGSESMDSAIIATEVGEYIVEVTMGADVCYTLCDTVNINEFNEPEVTIGRGLEGQCDIPPSNTLSLQQNIDATPFSFIWEDGSTEQTRIVADEGIYSVTVTDQCTVTAEAQVAVAFPPPLPESISIVDPGEYCEGGDLELLVVDQDLTPIDIDLYTLTVGSSVVNNPIIIPETLICDSLYVVDLTTVCGTLTSSIDITACSCFRWPQLFFPSSRVEVSGEIDNKTFAPINKCESVDDFELHIYNRWGNEVFEGSSFENGWNGRFGDDEAPQGVYVWWARYSNNGVEFTDRGNVTLLR